MQDGLSALHCAARSGHVATTAQLLKLGASVTSRTRRGLSALHLAVQGDHTQCVELLTKACKINDVTNVCPVKCATASYRVCQKRTILGQLCTRRLNGIIVVNHITTCTGYSVLKRHKTKCFKIKYRFVKLI